MLTKLRPVLNRLILIVLAFIVMSATGIQPAEAQEVLSGWFHVIWGDPLPGQFLEGVQEYVVIDDQARWVRTRLDDLPSMSSTEIRELNNKRVRIIGSWEGNLRLGQTLSQHQMDFRVSSIEIESPQHAGAAEPDVFPSAVAGPQRWVNILCRFADSTDVTPKSKAYVEDLMGATQPGLDHYWRELSYENINLTGTAVVGWYNLPKPRSYYVYDRTGDGKPEFDRERAAQDCTGAADADIFFPDFSGINFMFNQLLDCCAWGGGATLTRDGETKRYSMTWLPPWGYEDQGVLGHEMGHGFGLLHSGLSSSGLYSRWDVMSRFVGNCPPYDITFGCIGVHTISYHMDKLGWIPSARKYVGTPGSSQSIIIERLSQPVSGSSYLMAQIPIGGSTTQFYTVEARRFAGYDVTLPGEAIVIHHVDIWRNVPALVVDPDNNGDPNDAGAMWTPGETFIDQVNDIVVSVDALTTTGFAVTISSGMALPIVTMAATDSTATEAGPTTGMFTVSRTGSTDSALSVNYTVGGTATPASDYFALSGNVVILTGQSSAQIVVTPKDDEDVNEGDETVIATLTANAAYTIGTPSNTTVTIADNDIVAPDTIINSGPSADGGATNSTSATFFFDSLAPAISSAGKSISPSALVVTYECSLDSPTFSPCNSPKTYTKLKVGSHTFRVRAVAGGVTDPTPAIFNWTIDTKAPNTTITSGPPVLTNNAVATFTFTSTEAGGGYLCSLDGGAFAPCASPFTTDPLADGKHNFQVKATDAAGNADKSAAKGKAWTVDTTPPNTSITKMPTNPTTSTSAAFKFTSTEKKSTFQCNLDGARFISCKSGQKYTGILPGPHNFQVQAIDAAGNIELAPASFNWTIQ